MAADEGNMKIEKLDGALNTFLEGLRPGVMLGGEQSDAQRLSEAIVVAGKLIELVSDKPSSDVSSRPMPRDSGNNGGDREKGNTWFDEGINAAKQGSRQGKDVDVEAVKPKRKPDAITSVQAIKSGERLGEATCSKVAESRDKGRLQVLKIEAWSKLRHLRHKGTLKEYVSRFRRLMLKVPSLTEEYGFFTFMFGLKPWAKKVLERRKVKELSKALTTAESIKNLESRRTRLPKQSRKQRIVTKDSVMKASQRMRNIVLEWQRNSLNDEPDDKSGEDECILGTISSVKDAKPRVRVEQTIGCRLKMPEVLQNYPRDESSKVMDEPKIELSKRGRTQDRRGVESWLNKRTSLETIIREGSKQGLVEDVQMRNNPSKTSRQDSKGAKTLRDKATTEKLPIYMVGSELQPSC
ncbi:hypothetical protein F3Y22_tig00110378pilonHSYRG00130 [Hibiscus syriacus]|uniref:Retrotransposon gag domain-containing protein n=1 Tax=Hibiscus syriacus TaxID=106335 RepID=A0A6A3ATQ1_HIBSY|nr:hypothetical protein F3Y22_tig00110378pilonHSYRG00130 [Hibiscus syriacus]